MRDYMRRKRNACALIISSGYFSQKKAAKYTGKGTNEVQQKTSVTRKATNYPSVSGKYPCMYIRQSRT